MAIDFTPLARLFFLNRSRRVHEASAHAEATQRAILKSLLRRVASTDFGKRYGVRDILAADDVYAAYVAKVPMVKYEDIREDVIRMVNGEADVMWPGVCLDFAQSSGTSDGRSKFIPITRDSLNRNHYKGAACPVAFYLDLVPESRIFSGKGFILGGSFASRLRPENPKAKVGDLSATLISKINPLANLMRIPDKKTALMPDWETKLPALVKASAYADVTNISGVPSWFLTVIKKVLESRGTTSLAKVWPHLEVFFHGGISFEPYREEYRKLCGDLKMHFLETYNASEGFFAAQDDFSESSMLLILDSDIFYEFLPLGGGETVPVWKIEKGKVYEMIISASNGLWRYRLGDTVIADSVDPVKIRIVGRTKSFINAFGEELMEDNAENAIAEAARATGASVLNYTAAPVFASDSHRGRHQWLIEWDTPPENMDAFRDNLDAALRRLNSDYDAKRAHTIFLDPPEIVTASGGLFNRWLKEAGSHKLGGQRKVPRLSNSRDIIERLLEMNA